MKLLFGLSIVGLLLMVSCRDKTGETCAFVPETASLHETIAYESLEDPLPAVTTKSQLVGFLGQHPEVRDYFFHRGSYPNDSVFVNELYGRFTNPHLDTLLMTTHGIFKDPSALKKEFEQAFDNLNFYYPDFNRPKVQTIITGIENGSDLYVSDSLVIVGLDYFLGDKAKYRPNMYEYMLRRYNKNFIVPSVCLLMGIDTHFNRINPSDRTVLADMVAYGKAFYFTKQMLPCTPDSILIGYTKKEMKESREFENLIWSRFVEDQVLFSTSHLVKQKYIAERPKTVDVGVDCPGRIGTWIGWQIVKKYMETHPEVTLPQLMQMDNASQLFNDSGYKPQVVKVPGKEKV